MHTPGPWSVQTHYGDERFHDEDSDSNYCVVLPEAGSFPEDSICEVWGTEHDDEANARVIAAAPDLLEALAELDKASLKAVQIMNLADSKYPAKAPTVAEYKAAKQELHEARQLAMHALAKAKGDPS